MTIDLAADLQLPNDAVTRSYAFLAMKGAGKSNALVVFAEELAHAGLPWVAIDPKGDWWGIRSNADGTGPGVAVPIFGGLHADVPIKDADGALLADLIVDEHLSALVDTSEFSKAESIRFLQAFFDRLYRRKNKATYPMHLFLEEADDYVPQRTYREIAGLVRTVELIVKRGRQRGLGISLASQRAASVNKDVLTQTDTLVALRNTSPQDRKAIEAWLTWHAQGKDVAAELATLEHGEAWISSPEQLKVLQRVRFHRRGTFDSGATPELGEKVKAATLADVDMAAIEASFATRIEQARADDPKHLRAEVRRLQAQVTALEHELTTGPAEPVAIPVIPAWVVNARDDIKDALDRTRRAIEDILAAYPENVGSARPATIEARPIVTEPQARERAVGGTGALVYGKREHAILRALAQFPDGRTERELALLTGYSAKASTIGAGLSALRKAGYVQGRQITAAGIARLEQEGDYEPLPTGRALLDHWRNKLGKRERVILEALLEVAPRTLTHDELAARTGYSPDASTIGAGLSTLRGLKLVDGWHVSAELLEAIAE